MRIQTEISYPADAQTVSVMTFDKDFQARKCAATGALDYVVDVSQSGEHTVVTTTRDMPTADFPDFVRSMVGQRLKITEVDTWAAADADGGRSGTVLVTVGGTPIRFEGTLRLSAAGAGATGQVDGELRAGVPFIGARIEQAAAPAITGAMKAEETTAAQWLAEHAP